MTVPAVLLCAHTPVTQYIVGGLPLLLRHIIELYRLGVTEVYLVGPSDISHVARHRRLPTGIVLHPVPCTRAATLQQQLRALPIPLQDALILWSQWVIDPRLLRALLVTLHPQWLVSPGASSKASPVAARLSPEQFRSCRTRDITAWFQENPPLDPATLDTYSPAHRGPVDLYLQPLTTPDDAVVATHRLIAQARKTTMDLIASILDRLFVNRLVFWLSYTRITPNQITLATGVLGALAAWLFLSGWLPGGVLLAYAAATLDGVDGKLARTTLQFSRLGELEHVLDFFMEQSWYLTITTYLAATTGKHSLLWIGGGLMICDLIVKVLYGCGRLLFGKHLEELGHFDRIFRRIGGRRNIYIAILLIGALTGFPQQALGLALAWALLTVAVHMSRMMYHLSQRTAPV